MQDLQQLNIMQLSFSLVPIREWSHTTIQCFYIYDRVNNDGNSRGHCMMIAQPLLWAGVFSRSSHACTKCPPCKKIVGLHIGRAGASSLQDGALHRRRCAGSALLCRRVLPKFDTRPATSQRRCRSSPAPKGKNGWGYVVRIGAISISISISLYLYISISLYLYLYIYISIYLYIYISIYLYIYISTYLHIYISTSRSRSRSRSISISISIFFLRLRHGPGGVPGPLHGEESLHLCAGDPGASAGVCHVGPSAPTAVAGLHRQRRRPVGPGRTTGYGKKGPSGQRHAGGFLVHRRAGRTGSPTFVGCPKPTSPTQSPVVT